MARLSLLLPLLALAAGSGDIGDGTCAEEAEGPQRARSLLSVRTGFSLPPLAFIKTHKTGSSTMANILARLAGERSLKSVRANDEGLVNWAKLRAEEKPKHAYDLVYNHEIFDEEAVREYLKPGAFLFTIVREPLSVVDSMFRYRADLFRGNFNRSMTWKDRLAMMEGDRATWSNPQARDLGWYGATSIRRLENVSDSVFEQDGNESAVAAFLKGLDKAFDLVLLTERYDEGLLMLRSELRLPLESLSYVRAKVTEAEQVPPSSKEEEAAARKFLRVDEAIYKHFEGRFRKRWQELGKAQGELAELRGINEGLEKACAEPRNVTACPDSVLKQNFARP